MSIDLQKGQRVDIGLSKVAVGLGWKANAGASAHDFDLDASAFVLNKQGKLPADEFFVFYNNLISPDGAVESLGDNRVGGGGDDETINVDLQKVDPRVDQIIICVSIFDAEARKQNFGQVRDAFVRIYEQASGSELAKYELDEDFSTESVVEFGRLYLREGAWRFEALGVAHQGGLAGLVQKYA